MKNSPVRKYIIILNTILYKDMNVNEVYRQSGLSYKQGVSDIITELKKGEFVTKIREERDQHKKKRRNKKYTSKIYVRLTDLGSDLITFVNSISFALEEYYKLSTDILEYRKIENNRNPDTFRITDINDIGKLKEKNIDIREIQDVSFNVITSPLSELLIIFERNILNTILYGYNRLIVNYKDILNKNTFSENILKEIVSYLIDNLLEIFKIRELNTIWDMRGGMHPPMNFNINIFERIFKEISDYYNREGRIEDDLIFLNDGKYNFRSVVSKYEIDLFVSLLETVKPDSDSLKYFSQKIDNANERTYYKVIRSKTDIPKEFDNIILDIKIKMNEMLEILQSNIEERKYYSSYDADLNVGLNNILYDLKGLIGTIIDRIDRIQNPESKEKYLKKIEFKDNKLETAKKIFEKVLTNNINNNK